MILADPVTLGVSMDRAAAGDAAAFGAVAEALQDDLFRLALAQGLKRDDAVEAVQEALARAYARRADFRPGADAAAWLRGFVVNTVRECRRRMRPTEEWDDADGSDQSAPQAPAETGAAEADELDRLRNAIDRLPPRQREAVACRFLRRMSVSQTAAAMGCAEGTVKSAVNAGLKRLRELLEGRP